MRWLDSITDSVDTNLSKLWRQIASQVALVVKNLPAKAADARDLGSIPELGRSPGEGNGNPLQYSCLKKFHGQRSLECCSPWGH